MKRILLLMLSLSLCLFLFSACELNVTTLGGMTFQYDDASEYVMGGASISEEVRTLDINWVNGNVRVAYHDGDDIQFSESSDDELNESTSLYYRIKDGELTVQFVRSGTWTDVNLEKKLLILLPAGMVEGEYTHYDFSFETVNADVTLEEVHARSCKFENISGKTTASFGCSIDEVSVSTISGNADIRAVSIGEMKVETVSGNVSVHVTDGDELPIERFDGESISGLINLELPTTASFVLEFESVSGSAKLGFEYQKKPNMYIVGRGEAEFEIETVSGDVYILAN